MPLFLSFLHCTPFIFPVEKNSVIDSADIVSHRVMQLMHVPPNVTSRSPLLIATVAALIILTIMTSSYTIFQDKWISFNLLSCHPKRGLRPLKHRNLMGDLLEEYGFKTGVEVGVKQGAYAKIVQGGPSASGKIYVDIKFKVLSLAALSKLGKGPVFRQSGEAADFL